ncbi:membrane protein [Desulfocarbo indianensis]|nr:membrane protein [Desulfocarbo indianensis]
MRKSASILMLAILLLAGNAQAADTGREIMLKVDAVDNSRDAVMSSVMVIERGDAKLIRRMEHMTKNYGDALKDERTLIRFVEPADVRGTAYLTWSYDDPEREDDMWMFLPAESLVRRISGGGKKGAFMRSDLANEDIEDRAIDDDIHTLKGSAEQHGADCYVIESVPRPELKRDTNYSKRVQYIRKDIYLPCRVEYYDKRGKLLKIGTHGGFKRIDGIWTITKSIIETPRRKTRTLYQRSEITYNQGLDDGLFLQSNLKR